LSPPPPPGPNPPKPPPVESDWPKLGEVRTPTGAEKFTWFRILLKFSESVRLYFAGPPGPPGPPIIITCGPPPPPPGPRAAPPPPIPPPIMEVLLAPRFALATSPPPDGFP